MCSLAGSANTMIEIVACAFVTVAEDVVGRGDCGKALSCFWIRTVAVWMVFEGESVELSFLGNR